MDCYSSHGEPGHFRQPPSKRTGRCISNKNDIAAFLAGHTKNCLGGIANLDPVLVRDTRLVEAPGGGHNGPLAKDVLKARADLSSLE